MSRLRIFGSSAGEAPSTALLFCVRASLAATNHGGGAAQGRVRKFVQNKFKN